MMNPIVIVARDCHAFLHDAIESALDQDIRTYIIAVNNGSLDGATQLLYTYQSEQVQTISYFPQHGVAHGWNRGLEIAWSQGAEHCLVINADVILRRDFYRLLLEDGGGFVTGVGVRGKEIAAPDGAVRVLDHLGCEAFPASPRTDVSRDHPDFSAWLIRKWVWDKVGGFDENFRGAFCEDADYHVRMHKAGIRAYCIDLPFFHRGSMTIKTALSAEAKHIAEQAGRNREYFKTKWGCAVGSTEYYHDIFGHDAPGDAELQMT